MRHIIVPLLRRSLMPSIIVIQAALACAIICNALFFLQQKTLPLMATDGIGNPESLIVAWQIAPRGQPWSAARLLDIQASLRATPGVASISAAATLPMEVGAAVSADLVTDSNKEKANAVIYIGDNLVSTLGLKLIEGRNFDLAEDATRYQGVGLDQNGTTIITKALANRLFPDGNSLGKTIRIGEDADAARRTVVGVVDHLMRNQLGQDDNEDIGYSMIFPGTPNMWPLPVFGVRAIDESSAARVRKTLQSVLDRDIGPELVSGIEPRVEMFQDFRDRALANAKASVWLLSGVTIVVLLVTLGGIFGMTNYWTQQRTKEFGIRRALGAKQRHVLLAVQIENLLLMGLGALIGAIAAYGVNIWLMQHFELSALPWMYLPIGGATLLLLGQLSVLKPALNAASVPPMVATRSL